MQKMKMMCASLILVFTLSMSIQAQSPLPECDGQSQMPGVVCRNNSEVQPPDDALTAIYLGLMGLLSGI